MKQSSIEWLEKELYEKFEVKGDAILYYETLEKAKEMHKQEVIDAYVDGGEKGFNKFGENSEQYYNETFKTESNGTT
jgi:hypothetical protein